MTYPEKPYAGLALLTDLDGTLLTPEKTVSPEDAAAIAEFRRKGGLFSIATGRGTQATQEFLDLLQPDFPAVMYNGALLYDPAEQKIVTAAHLPAETAALLSELIREFPDVGAEVLCEEGVFVLQLNEQERQHLEITHIPIVMKTLAEIRITSCFKALFAGAPERIAKMQEYVRAERFSAVSVIGATGDFDNDAAMLSAADYSGCPADSQPSVLNAVSAKNGFRSEKTCENGFFADWIAAFVRRCGR